MEEKVTNAFNKHPIVFDDTCGLSPTIQRVYVRLYSWLWGNNENEWKGSYPKLAQLTKLSVGSVHEARKKLVEAGLISVDTLPNKGNTDTLSIKVTPDRLWTLNKRYCMLSLGERDIFAQQYSWETLDQLAQYLSEFEKQRSSLSENERRFSNNENRQAQRLSKSEKHLSNNERQRVSENASEGGSQVPTDRSTDITDNQTDDSSALSLNAQFIFDCCVEDQEYAPKLETKVIEYCEKIAEHVSTREQYDSLRDFTRPLIKGDDKTVYLGNMASKVKVWVKEQSQQTLEGREDDYIEGVGMPADTYNLAARLCRKYQIKLDPGEYITKELERIYRLVKSKSRFEHLLRDAGEKSVVIEDFLKQLEDGISVKL